MAGAPGPAPHEVWELAGKLGGWISGGLGLFLALAREWSQRQNKRERMELDRDEANAEEAMKLRDELRRERDEARADRDHWRRRSEWIQSRHVELRELLVRTRLEVLGMLDLAVMRLEDAADPVKLALGLGLLKTIRDKVEALQLPTLEDEEKK